MSGPGETRWAVAARYAVVVLIPVPAAVVVGYSMSGSSDRMPWHVGLGILGMIAVMTGEPARTWRPVVPLLVARKPSGHFRVVVPMIILALVANDAYIASRTSGGVAHLWLGVGLELVVAVGYSLLLWGPALWNHPVDVVPPT